MPFQGKNYAYIPADFFCIFNITRKIWEGTKHKMISLANKRLFGMLALWFEDEIYSD